MWKEKAEHYIFEKSIPNSLGIVLRQLEYKERKSIQRKSLFLCSLILLAMTEP